MHPTLLESVCSLKKQNEKQPSHGAQLLAIISCPLFIFISNVPNVCFFLIINTFSLQRAKKENVFNAPLRFYLCRVPCCVHCCFLYGQSAHHTAVLISSSIREHRLTLSLLTYSSETTLLFEQWWADVVSIDGLSCCIMSPDEKGAWSMPCIHEFAIKLTYRSVFNILFFSLYLVS